MKRNSVIDVSLFFIILACLASGCGIAQSKITNEKRLKFINAILQDTIPIKFNIFNCVAERDTGDFKIDPQDSVVFVQSIGKLKNHFSEEDGAFMWKQLADAGEFKLEQASIENRKIIDANKFKKLPDDQFWDYIERDYQVDRYCAVGFPLFSRDQTKVLVAIWLYSDDRKEHGWSYGEYVYHLVNGKWIYLDQISFVD